MLNIKKPKFFLLVIFVSLFFLPVGYAGAYGFWSNDPPSQCTTGLVGINDPTGLAVWHGTSETNGFWNGGYTCTHDLVIQSQEIYYGDPDTYTYSMYFADCDSAQFMKDFDTRHWASWHSYLNGVGQSPGYLSTGGYGNQTQIGKICVWQDAAALGAYMASGGLNIATGSKITSLKFYYPWLGGIPGNNSSDRINGCPSPDADGHKCGIINPTSPYSEASITWGTCQNGECNPPCGGVPLTGTQQCCGDPANPGSIIFDPNIEACCTDKGGDDVNPANRSGNNPKIFYPLAKDPRNEKCCPAGQNVAPNVCNGCQQCTVNDFTFTIHFDSTFSTPAYDEGGTQTFKTGTCRDNCNSGGNPSCNVCVDNPDGGGKKCTDYAQKATNDVYAAHPAYPEQGSVSYFCYFGNYSGAASMPAQSGSYYYWHDDTYKKEVGNCYCGVPGTCVTPTNGRKCSTRGVCPAGTVEVGLQNNPNAPVNVNGYFDCGKSETCCVPSQQPTLNCWGGSGLCVVGGGGKACKWPNDCPKNGGGGGGGGGGFVPTCNGAGQCVLGGGGAPCAGDPDCAGLPTACNPNLQCVAGIAGPACDATKGNADCAALSTCNAFKKCVVGGGGAPCTVATEVADCGGWTGCNDKQQCVPGGMGKLCTLANQAVDCAPVTHLGCTALLTCGVIQGAGANTCAVATQAVDCPIPQNTHMGCTAAFTCGLLVGAGANTCTVANQVANCPQQAQNHLGCVLPLTCGLLPGAGANTCAFATQAVDCPQPANTHVGCVAPLTCGILIGPGANTCSFVTQAVDCSQPITNQLPVASGLLANPSDYCASFAGSGTEWFNWTYYDAEYNPETKWQLQISTDSSFTSVIYNNSCTASSCGATSVPVPVLPSSVGSTNLHIHYGTTYYWRVRISDSYHNLEDANYTTAQDSFIYPYAHPAPSVSYTYSPTTVPPGSAATFLDTSTCYHDDGTPYSCAVSDSNTYQWWFGNGNTAVISCSVSDPAKCNTATSNSYIQPSSYQTKLQVCDDINIADPTIPCCYMTKTITVSSSAANLVPQWWEITPYQ